MRDISAIALAVFIAQVYAISCAASSNRKRFKSVGNARNVTSRECYCVGIFRTRMTEAILDRAEALVTDAMPMKRIGQPGELTPIVLFLASEGASYITGQVIVIVGGRMAQQ